MTEEKIKTQDVLKPESVSEAINWLNTEGKVLIPPLILTTILQLTKIYSLLEDLKIKHKNLYNRFLESMGLKKKSEKNDPKPSEESDLSPTDHDNAVALLAEHPNAAELKAQAREHEAAAKKLRDVIKKKRKNGRAFSNRRTQDQLECVTLSGPIEDLITAGLAEKTFESKTLRPSEVEKLNYFGTTKGLHSSFRTATRFELNISIKEIEYKIETVSLPGSDLKPLTVSMNEIGPAGSKITWNSLVTLILAFVGAALPVERISKIFTRFMGSLAIYVQLRNASLKFEPIYRFMAESLASANEISVDASDTKVIQISKEIKLGTYGKELLKNQATPEEESPFLPELVARTSGYLGRAFTYIKKKDGKTDVKIKKAVRVMNLHGRSDPLDPNSYIILFRTANGDCGNILDELLKSREKNKGLIYIQSDLSNQNLPSKHSFIHAGCAAHARRPFKRHESDDPILCDYFLQTFNHLFAIEADIKEKATSAAQVIILRKSLAEPVWKELIEKAKKCIEARSEGQSLTGRLHVPNSQLYQACKYIVKHQKALTLYLDKPNLALSNNITERFLRAEKMLLVSSKFRLSEEGRVVLDILRSMFATISAIGGNPREYFTWILKQKTEDIMIHADQFTPQAFLKKKAQNQAQVIAKAA